MKDGLKQIGLVAICGQSVAAHFYLVGRNIVDFENPNDGQNVIDDSAHPQKQHRPHRVSLEPIQTVLTVLDAAVSEHRRQDEEDVHTDAHQADNHHDGVLPIQPLEILLLEPFGSPEPFHEDVPGQYHEDVGDDAVRYQKEDEDHEAGVD